MDVAHQGPLSMEFSRQEYWSCHALLQGIFPTQGLNPGLHIAGRFFTVWATREALYIDIQMCMQIYVHIFICTVFLFLLNFV